LYINRPALIDPGKNKCTGVTLISTTYLDNEELAIFGICMVMLNTFEASKLLSKKTTIKADP